MRLAQEAVSRALGGTKRGEPTAWETPRGRCVARGRALSAHSPVHSFIHRTYWRTRPLGAPLTSAIGLPWRWGGGHCQGEPAEGHGEMLLVSLSD